MMDYSIQKINVGDISALKALNSLFSEVFEDPGSYKKHPPSDKYLQNLLKQEHFIALTAQVDEMIIGGLTAYVLNKFEQERSEIYIYDLAVVESYRRKKVATRLIRHLADLAGHMGAYVIFVQADQGDEPAISLYESLGIREEVLHFDISV